MKYIAFGIGKAYEHYCNSDIKKDIIAYTDNNYIGINEFEEKPVIKPSQISESMYDYIIIFSVHFFEEIYEQLINELNVPENKIISFWDIVHEDRHVALQRCGRDVIGLVKKMQWLKILDYTAFFSNLYYNKKSMGIGNSISLDAFVPGLEKMYPIYANLYDHIFYLKDCNLPEYDVVIYPYILSQSNNIQEELLEKVIRNARYLLIILCCKCDFKEDDKDIVVQKYGNILYTEYKAHGKYFIIDTKPNRPTGNIKIYTVSHKEFKEPEAPFYESIYVGKYGAEKEFIRSDSRGDNIAKYNVLINETTALYWIWKHSKEDYIGICHYRRFFLQSEERNVKNILKGPFAGAILEKYDIILPQPIVLGNLKEQLARYVDSRAFEEAWEIITCFIKKKQPDYWDSFEYFFNNVKLMYPYNMFVAKKDIVNSYCDWLFSFILDAVEEMDFSGYDEYSQRIIGFFIERLFNVWLLKQELRINELPILLID